MNGPQLARALVNIISKRPELEKAFLDHLSKWVKSSLMKGPTLDGLRGMRDAAGPEFIAWHLGRQPAEGLVTLAKKLDPHLPDLKGRGAADLRSHLEALIAGRTQPTPKPGRPAKKTRAAEEILRLANTSERRAEWKKLSPAELKAAIKNHHLDMGSLSRKPSKTEMIEHIEATIAEGWPRPRSVLDNSRY
jgi:hypothetical protein